ncbi:MAG: Hsp20/alpha crystallin family protein [Saprospiraceae bacterium]|nr:Hsp20/alpha crystallin family protein [Saprospiraceae bacterium]
MMTKIAKFRPIPSTNYFSNGLLDDFFNRSIADFVGSDALTSQPAVNIAESDVAFRIEVAAPGFEKGDFSLNVENDQLTLRAERKQENAENSERFTRREFRYASFERTFKLPETVNQDQVSAVYENGVLLIALPKKEEAKAISKTIAVG